MRVLIHFGIRTLVATGVFLLAAFSALPQTPDAEAQQKAGEIAQMQMRWDRKPNSLGADAWLKEVGRQEAAQYTIVFYQVHTSGLRKDRLYTLVGWDLNDEPGIVFEGLGLDASGRVICPQSQGSQVCQSAVNEPIQLAIAAARGEPKRYALISNDGTLRAYMTVVPFPIVQQDKGCSLEARLMLKDAEGVLLSGSGFPPNASIEFEGDSEGEVQRNTLKSDEGGSVSTVLLPYKKGVTQGKATVTLRAVSCSPAATFRWGKDTYKWE